MSTSTTMAPVTTAARSWPPPLLPINPPLGAHERRPYGLLHLHDPDRLDPDHHPGPPPLAHRLRRAQRLALRPRLLPPRRKWHRPLWRRPFLRVAPGGAGPHLAPVRAGGRPTGRRLRRVVRHPPRPLGVSREVRP